MPAMLLGGKALLDGAGSIFGGLFGSSGAAKQAKAIEKAAQIARQTALELNDRARGDVAPFRQFGIDAGNSLMGLLTGGKDVASTVRASPLFEFQSELGTRNINRDLAARGLFGSGAGLETLQRFNTQLVGEEGERIMSRLFGVTQLGANSAGQSAQLTSQTGNNIANMELQAGFGIGQAQNQQQQAIGGAISGGFNALGSGLGNFAQFKMFQPLLNNIALGGRGGGSGVGSGSIPMIFGDFGLTG